MGFLWIFFGDVWLGGFDFGIFWDFWGILWEFFGNSLGIFREFYRNSLGMYGGGVLNVWVLFLRNFDLIRGL